ncbi:MAG: hypothetical protein ACK52X_05835, partial [bacterium]
AHIYLFWMDMRYRIAGISKLPAILQRHPTEKNTCHFFGCMPTQTKSIFAKQIIKKTMYLKFKKLHKWN